MRCLPLILVLSLVLVPLGCSRPTGRVSGTVTLDGKALPGGTIIFLPEDNRNYLAAIGKDGHYEVAGIPFGKVRVAVIGVAPRSVPRPEPTKGGPSDEKGTERPRVATPGISVPGLFADPDKSGLVFELNEASKDFPVRLK
jgi:hypothetical protein